VGAPLQPPELEAACRLGAPRFPDRPGELPQVEAAGGALQVTAGEGLEEQREQVLLEAERLGLGAIQVHEVGGRWNRAR